MTEKTRLTGTHYQNVRSGGRKNGIRRWAKLSKKREENEKNYA
jgi:hypothetical protein